MARNICNKHILSGEKASWILFSVFTIVLFIIVVGAHWFLHHTIYLSSLWKAPSIFFAFWFPKICISLFLAFFVLLTKRKWWQLIVLAICNTWIIANIIYSRANNCLITWDAIMLASNLEGFGSSIGFYWNWQCWFFVIITILYALCLLFFKPSPIKGFSKWFIASFIFVIYFIGAECYRINMSNDTKTDSTSFGNYIPLYIPQHIRHNSWRAEEYYVQMHSMVAYLPMLINTAIVDAISAPNIKFTTEEQNTLFSIINSNPKHNLSPQYNIMFVLMESLESFAIEANDPEGNPYMGNLHALINESNVLYADKITSQVRQGTSIDGQQILTTGLLPLQNGAAAMSYGRNIYPNYAHLYDTSYLLNPFFAATWNQNIVTYSYGFKKMLGGSSVLKDEEVFNMIQPITSNTSDSSHIFLAITVSAHTPFDRIAPNPVLSFDRDMPRIIQNYLNCQHYTDSCFGVWYNEWISSPQASNTILVITGDHTIFKDATLQELVPYAQQADLRIASGKTYCPLIIQAPCIKENILVSDICYQMDVYPTIMHLIGCEDYFWKGFGVNLIDSTARANRSITETEAYNLSDKLIRMNYFASLPDSVKGN